MRPARRKKCTFVSKNTKFTIICAIILSIKQIFDSYLFSSSSGTKEMVCWQYYAKKIMSNGNLYLLLKRNDFKVSEDVKNVTNKYFDFFLVIVVEVINDSPNNFAFICCYEWKN